MVSIRGVLKRLRRLLPEPPSTNYLYRRIKPSPYDLLPARPVVYDIGSADARGSYSFGSPPKDAKVVCVDIVARPGVDLVADAHDLHMVPDGTADLALVITLLEHVRYPRKVIQEAFRILKPGGVVYVSVPFIYPFHSDPDDYHRFSYKGVAVLCEDFERVDYGFNRGPASTMHQLLVHFLGMLFCFNSAALYAINVYVFRWLLFWVKYLDVFLARYKMAYVIHAGAYFIGRKPKRA